MQGIVCAYIGVHEMFQLALAAEEMGELRRFYCSLADLPGKWGRFVTRIRSTDAARPLGVQQLPPGKITELPLPLLSRRVGSCFHRRAPSDYHASNDWFDRSVARRLPGEDAAVFVGAETCALHSLRAAGRLGMKRVLDCPGIPASFLTRQIQLSGEELKIEVSTPATSSRMLDRKARELEETDVILLCSDLQRQLYAQSGIPVAKLRTNDLWADPIFLNHSTPVPPQTMRERRPLRVLFAGSGTVAKGAPYAILAAELTGDDITLAFCGGIDSTVRKWAGDRLRKHRVMDRVPRRDLAAVYHDHDVLLFPTLGDSFGFVAMEAMACGLPVITTTHAGVPLPDPSWRVPPRDAEAMARRLQLYARDRALLERDGSLARAFAAQFTPLRFRERAGRVFRELLT